MIDFLFRWLHLLGALVWVGLLFYFNFVHASYVGEASSEALPDVKAKLLPKALAWFRWAAVLTFVTGLILFVGVFHRHLINSFTLLGVVLGTLMFLNVWLIIWPNQKVIMGIKEGDLAESARKAALASRSNVLFSAPMVFCMLASPHLGYNAKYLFATSGIGLGVWISLFLVALLEVNAVAGKLGPLKTIRGVIHLSFALTALMYLFILFL